MSFSTIRLSSVDQLASVISHQCSQSLTDAKKRAADQLHEDLLLEGWSYGPDPWSCVFRTTAPRSDTLEAAMARVAAKKARFTVLEETTHVSPAQAPARSRSQAQAQAQVHTYAQVQAQAQARVQVQAQAQTQARARSQTQAEAQAQAQAEAQAKAQHFRMAMVLEGWSVSPNPWELPQRIRTTGSDTYEAAVARVVAKYPFLSL